MRTTLPEINPSVFRRFPFRPKIKGTSTLPGRFPSNHVGQGREYYSLRIYQPGDEARKIDWKRSARTYELTVKEEVAENNMRIWAVRDLSTSTKFGEKPSLIRGFNTFVEHILREGNNSLGCIGFSSEIDIFSRPQMGKMAIRPLRALLQNAGSEAGKIANIKLACDRIRLRTRRGDVIFFVSDFLSMENLQGLLESIPHDRELIPVIIRDTRENIHPSLGNARISFQDMETGNALSLSEISFLDEYDENLKKIFSALSLGYLWLEGDCYNDAITQIVEWLRRRIRIH